MILQLTPEIWTEIFHCTLQTLYMTVASTIIAYVIGIPIGIILNVTSPNGIKSNKIVYNVLGIIVNIIRSIPFLILAVAISPLTEFIVQTTIGSSAMVVALSFCAAPFIGRLVEQSLNEVDHGKVEAAKAMGSSDFTIITKVLIKEATPSLIVGVAIAITTILGFTASAGFIGGGGLGDFAYRYGVSQYKTDHMIAAIAILIIVVQIFQVTLTFISKKVDKRRNK